MNEDNGWIKLHRNIAKWEWSDDPQTLALFIHCLISANREDKKWHGKKVRVGSFITSYAKLAKKVGITVRSTRTILCRLNSTQELTIKTTNKYTLITINNWNDYQQTTQSSTIKRQATDKQPTTNKNQENQKNIKGDFVKNESNGITPFTGRLKGLNGLRRTI